MDGNLSLCGLPTAEINLSRGPPLLIDMWRFEGKTMRFCVNLTEFCNCLSNICENILMLKCKVRIATYSRNSLISILDENVFCFVKVGKPSRQRILITGEISSLHRS